MRLFSIQVVTGSTTTLSSGSIKKAIEYRSVPFVLGNTRCLVEGKQAVGPYFQHVANVYNGGIFYCWAISPCLFESNICKPPTPC